MTIDVDAVYEDGVLKPERPLALKEKSKVHVTIEAGPEAAPAPAAEDDDPTGWKTAMELKGCIKVAPPDIAENHDKYLYGDSCSGILGYLVARRSRGRRKPNDG